VVAALWYFPVFKGRAVRGPLTKNLSHAKILATGCQLYAIDHDGRFPMHLNELAPDYVRQKDLDEWRFTSLGHSERSTILIDWLYFGAGFDDKNPPALLIASPQASTFGKTKQSRIAIAGDAAGAVISEADYQKRLTETVQQMRALDYARHPKSPTASPPKLPLEN